MFEIAFDDEIEAFIMLFSLPKSLEAMKMVVSSFAGKTKLKYHDMILVEEGLVSILNIDTQGRGHAGNSNKGISKMRTRVGASQGLGNKVLARTMAKHVTSKEIGKIENNTTNTVTQEVYNAPLVAIHSPIDD